MQETTRDIRGHVGTRITQTNLTTIPTHQRTRTTPHDSSGSGKSEHQVW